MDRPQAVLVTGAAGGIGQALCWAFRERGYRVIATDRRRGESRCEAFIEADLEELCSEPKSLEAFVGQTEAAVGTSRLTALVNNAALQLLGSTSDTEPADLERVLRVNVLAPFVLSRALLQELSASGGSIVNIGSVHATLTKPGFVAYATSKAALLGLTRALAVDLGGRVRVNAVNPGATATQMLLEGFEGKEHALEELGQMQPLRRIAEPDEVAQAAVYLASEQASFITGACLSVDGGIGIRLHDPA